MKTISVGGSALLAALSPVGFIALAAGLVLVLLVMLGICVWILHGIQPHQRPQAVTGWISACKTPPSDTRPDQGKQDA